MNTQTRLNSSFVTAANISPEGTSSRVLYHERQWVPWYWWVFGALIVALITAQLAHNRSIVWLIVPAIVLTGIAIWSLLALSATTVTVEEEPDGSRWLKTSGAELPNDVVSRTLAVPATAKRNALGRQLDPAAFVVSHGWVNEMVMFVLDDEDDPTPYWLIGSKDPQALIRAFVGD